MELSNVFRFEPADGDGMLVFSAGRLEIGGDAVVTRLSFSISLSSCTKSATDSSAVPSDGLSLSFFFNVEWFIRGILLDPLELRVGLATDFVVEELDRLLVE